MTSNCEKQQTPLAAHIANDSMHSENRQQLRPESHEVPARAAPVDSRGGRAKAARVNITWIPDQTVGDAINIERAADNGDHKDLQANGTASSKSNTGIAKHKPQHHFQGCDTICHRLAMPVCRPP